MVEAGGDGTLVAEVAGEGDDLDAGFGLLVLEEELDRVAGLLYILNQFCRMQYTDYLYTN